MHVRTETGSSEHERCEWRMNERMSVSWTKALLSVPSRLPDLATESLGL